MGAEPSFAVSSIKMSEARDNFLRHLAQTSESLLGLEIERAEGSWLYTTDGRRYLDLIAGIGVWRSAMVIPR